MKRKWKLRSVTYVYARGFEAGTLHKHTLWKRARRTAVEPGAAVVSETGRKGRAKHEAGNA